VVDEEVELFHFDPVLREQEVLRTPSDYLIQIAHGSFVRRHFKCLAESRKALPLVLVDLSQDAMSLNEGRFRQELT
jgi:hypothetical protein